MLRNHIQNIMPPSSKDDKTDSPPITKKMVWDWIGILRWLLPGIVVAGLWLWNTSASSAAKDIQAVALIAKQETFEKSVDKLITVVDKLSLTVERLSTVVEAHEKRLDKQEGR
jgi:hypothetical protein